MLSDSSDKSSTASSEPAFCLGSACCPTQHRYVHFMDLRTTYIGWPWHSRRGVVAEAQRRYVSSVLNNLHWLARARAAGLTQQQFR